MVDFKKSSVNKGSIKVKRMKQLIIILIISGLNVLVKAQPNNPRSIEVFPVFENGLWGYINKFGQSIIKPKFRSAGLFQEGLAPARLDGTYGYIDIEGNYILQPQYDVAYPFLEGRAKVYLDGKPYYINHQGDILFEHPYSEIYDFGENDFSIVSTKSEKYGVINQKGELIIDTLFNKIFPFDDGLAIVYGQNHNPYPDKKKKNPVYEIGIINIKGEFIVPFGRYKDIAGFKNGYSIVKFNVERQKGWYNHEGVIDREGNLQFIIPSTRWHFDIGHENYSENLAIVDIYMENPNTAGINNIKTYKGVINTQGEILFSNKDWVEMTPYKKGRAFIQNKNEEWYLVNRSGEILNKEPYLSILYRTSYTNPNDFFQDGKHFVQTEKGWQAIDTAGLVIIPPINLECRPNDMYRSGDLIFYEKNTSKEKDDFSYRYGIWNTKTGILIEPQFQYINQSDFSDDLIIVEQDDRIGYINHLGNYVWREINSEESHSISAVNIDYMQKGYCYASCPVPQYFGHGIKKNDYKKIAHDSQFESDSLSILVNTDDSTRIWENNKGIKLYLANSSKDTLYFKAQDNRLSLNLQALDKNGEWKDIEYLPDSWCGNSYHSLFLPPDHYWEFAIPVYEGDIKTKLRAKLIYNKINVVRSSKKGENLILYSNEFEGTVNPGQFWRKIPYFPTGIMDPYTN